MKVKDKWLRSKPVHHIGGVTIIQILKHESGTTNKQCFRLFFLCLITVKLGKNIAQQ